LEFLEDFSLADWLATPQLSSDSFFRRFLLWRRGVLFIFLYQGKRDIFSAYWTHLQRVVNIKKKQAKAPPHRKKWFCCVAYNSRLFNGFNNCTLWSIIVAIPLGKCAHRRRHAFGSATYVLASFKVKICIW
jgi:hypothetical protein